MRRCESCGQPGGPVADGGVEVVEELLECPGGVRPLQGPGGDLRPHQCVVGRDDFDRGQVAASVSAAVDLVV